MSKTNKQYKILEDPNQRNADAAHLAQVDNFNHMISLPYITEVFARKQFTKLYSVN